MLPNCVWSRRNWFSFLTADDHVEGGGATVMFTVREGSKNQLLFEIDAHGPNDLIGSVLGANAFRTFIAKDTFSGFALNLRSFTTSNPPPT